LRSPEVAKTHPNAAAARALPSNRVIGGPESVVAQLEELLRASDADELMVSTVAHGLDARRRSLELLATAWAE
jgi:alkanesulfonate monooxygenase SsuD/methylene tetrahydromethanopterin reductase-like flavin-dependent oxidoreductase (luciferase family)